MVPKLLYGVVASNRGAPDLKLMPLTHSSSSEVLVGTTWPPGHMQKLKTPRESCDTGPRA